MDHRERELADMDPVGRFRDRAADYRRHRPSYPTAAIDAILTGLGTAESTGLLDGAVSLVLCAQSFHWFRARPALEAFHRILSPGSRLALMWNNRDRTDPLTEGYIEAIHQVQGEDPAEMRPFDPEIVPRSGRFSPAVLSWFPNQQRLDRDGLLGRATSASYVPKQGPRFERLRELLAQLWDRHRDAEGFVTLRYRTSVVFAERLPSAT